MTEFTPNIFAPIEGENQQLKKENQIETENPQEKGKEREGITAKIREAADPHKP